jgi:hypothetical protein
MADPMPRFQRINLVVRDMDAVLTFYRTLGLPIQGGDAADWPPGVGPEIPIDPDRQYTPDVQAR